MKSQSVMSNLRSHFATSSGSVRFREPKPVVSTLDMVHEAARLMKMAGFILHCPSRKTEACYYKLPGRTSLIRVAAHAKTKSLISRDVVASLTFVGTHLMDTGHMRLRRDQFEKMVHLAVGRYMIKSAERDLCKSDET